MLFHQQVAAITHRENAADDGAHAREEVQERVAALLNAHTHGAQLVVHKHAWSSSRTKGAKYRFIGEG